MDKPQAMKFVSRFTLHASRDALHSLLTKPGWAVGDVNF